MSTLTPRNANDKKTGWLSRNKGVLIAISRELEYSRVFVSDVFWGRRTSRSGDVEQKLAEAKAPGFDPATTRKAASSIPTD